MKAVDELWKYSSSKSQANGIDIILVRWGISGSSTGYRSCWEALECGTAVYMVVEGEGSESQLGDPDTGECPMKPGIGESVVGILKALGGACAL